MSCIVGLFLECSADTTSLQPTVPALQVLKTAICHFTKRNGTRGSFQPLPKVTTPLVYEGLCTEKLLVMEYLPGIKISNVAKIEAAG